MEWQPSDIEPQSLVSVHAWVEHARASNVRMPLALDMLQWASSNQGEQSEVDAASFDAVFCANMIHIAPWQACVGLMKLAGHALLPGGVLITYGPYRIAGQHTAPSNERFDEWLAAKDRRYGVRDLEAVTDVAQAAGLRYRERIAMPANNFCLLFEREASSG